MVGKLIVKGLIAGICAGLLAFGFARVFGEPAVNIAVQFESAQDEARDAAAHAAGQAVEPEQPEIFSRSVQSGIGLLTGVVSVGAGLGALFAILFAIANGRVGTWSPGATCVLLALLGWISVYLVPALKYPANPPSVGQPDTIQMRTGLYFLIMAISIAASIGAWALGRRLVRRRGLWNGCVGALIAYVLVLAIVFQLLPPINEVPPNFPAVTLWNFRMASAGLQFVLWGGIALIFGTMVEMAQAAGRSSGHARLSTG